MLFDGDGQLFEESVKGTKVYFEYGSGNSTIYMDKNSDAQIYTVDTNRNYLNGLKKDLSLSPICRWADIGKIKGWGYPTDLSLIEKFRQYTENLWELGISPDYILIDGSFRVACFFTSIKNAKVGTKILFDGYPVRPEYHVVESIIKPESTLGTQALFIVTQESKDKLELSMIEEYLRVAR